MKANWPLLALATGAFGIGTTEFAPMGLLPIIAQGVHVSIPAAGLLVSAYAVGVLLGAPIITLALGRLRTRTALILLMLVFTAGNLLAAVAPDYATLFCARVVTSLSHGAFFGLGSVMAASLVAPDKRAGAVATMFMGLTIANIGGVPAAAWIGGAIGWRAAFAATAGLGMLAILALRLALPAGIAGSRPDLRGEVAVLTRPVVVAALATTAVGTSAMFTLYTYVTPILHTLTTPSPAFVTMMLVVIGIGFTIGNKAGGWLADRSVKRSLIVSLALVASTMFVFPFLAGSRIGVTACLLVWGVATFGMVPGAQLRVMHAASEAPALASSVNIGAFNLGNALGAAGGGAALRFGWGYAAVPWIGAVLAVCALLLVLGTMPRSGRT